MRFRVDGQRYELAASARHQLLSALAALAVAREIGMQPSEVDEGLRSFVGPPSRCRVEQIGEWTVIDDSYNASPLSMQAACDCLSHWPTAGQRILVCGDMLELGPDAPRWHAEIGAEIARSGIDRLLVVGELAPHVVRGARAAGLSIHQIAAFRDLEPLLSILECWLQPGDAVLVKGSRGMRMERVLDWMKTQVDAPPSATPPFHCQVA